MSNKQATPSSYHSTWFLENIPKRTFLITPNQQKSLYRNLVTILTLCQKVILHHFNASLQVIHHPLPGLVNVSSDLWIFTQIFKASRQVWVPYERNLIPHSLKDHSPILTRLKLTGKFEKIGGSSLLMGECLLVNSLMFYKNCIYLKDFGNFIHSPTHQVFRALKPPWLRSPRGRLSTHLSDLMEPTLPKTSPKMGLGKR